MNSRRRAREAALQALYQCDTLCDWRQAQIDVYFQVFNAEALQAGAGTLKENFEFSRGIIVGVIENLEFIDGQIGSASTHWTLSRMSRVDRNILRAATYEIIFISEIPVSVSINEAIEIAKRYGTADSPMFINGVLDNIATVFMANPDLVLKAQAKVKKVVNE